MTKDLANDEVGKTSAIQKSNIDAPNSLEGILNQMLEVLTDKTDESVKMAIQRALVKILAAESLQTTEVLQKYREKHPKLTEQFNIIILQAIEMVVRECNNLNTEAYKRIINLALEELTHSSEHMPVVQNHALEILVAIGSHDKCPLVVEALMAHAKEKTVAQHFMVMQCLGRLASNNVSGILVFVHSILTTVLVSLGNIRHDHVKQSYAYAIGRLSEALLEQTSAEISLSLTATAPPLEDVDTALTIPASELEVVDSSTEISIAYDVFFNHWLNGRDPKTAVEVLHALSSMFPLLPVQKIQDQSARIIPQILSLYRRSIERNSITQFLSAALKTFISLETEITDNVVDQMISQLFDLVCVYPDYEKPQTVKGHYEVLRCFHLISSVYGQKVMDTLLMHLRNNSERERIKSLLILTHLLNASTKNIENKLYAFLECLKQMINVEKSIKMKMTLLKTIVALAQKSYINEKEFVWFIVRYSCKYQRVNQEYGSLEEHANFVLSCESSLFMLSSTVGTMDELLKRELLNYFVLFDYTDICSNLAKCLASLFAKSASIEYDVCTDADNKATGSNVGPGEEAKLTDCNEDASLKTTSEIKPSKIMVPLAEIIFGRCLALLGNYHCIKRIKNILSFLQNYYMHLHPKLEELWSKLIPDLFLHLEMETTYFDKLNNFIYETNVFLKTQDKHFAERLSKSMADQILMYPLTLPTVEFVVPVLEIERGMLLKALALTVCHAGDPEHIEDKIDLIITSARQEKLDKHNKQSDYEKKIISHAQALGYISTAHFDLLNKKLIQLVENIGKKQSTGFFSNLHFMKDTQKELENYKVNLLLVKTLDFVMNRTDPKETISKLDENILNYMTNLLQTTKDQILMSAILKTLLNICQKLSIIGEVAIDSGPAKCRKEIVEAVFNIPLVAPYDDLPLLSIILKLGTAFIYCDKDEPNNLIDGGVIFEIACKNFFTCAQHLKMKFESIEEDNHNSYLAKHLNESLPELSALVSAIIKVDPSPSTLDLIVSILEAWTRDRNCEVRVCASQVFSNALDVYIKTMKIGCEAPSKFNQTGQMLAQIVPRCLDSKDSVRQLSIDILQKTLEIACIYETLTIADPQSDWIKDLEMIRENILSDDPKNIQKLSGDIAKVIAIRISNFQYLQFCKNLLQGLRDPESSSAVGAAIVLKAFMQHRGSELFHAIPEIIKDSLTAIQQCELEKAKLGVLNSLVVLTKHHPKLVSTELLLQPLPLDKNLVKFWQLICDDQDLTLVILDYFIQTLYSSNLYELNETNEPIKRKPLANIQPLSIFCALHELLSCPDIKEQLKLKFADLFAILLTSLATYTNIPAPPTSNLNSAGFGSIHHGKELYALLNPCQIALETFNSFLQTLSMEQILSALNVHNELAASTNLKSFIEVLTPMAIGLSNEINIHSDCMKKVVTAISKYVSSPFESQRVASIGFLSRLVPLKPCGDIVNIIMNQLAVALSDPSPVIRGLSIQGMGHVGCLVNDGIEMYTDTAISSLLKGIDDTNTDCLINTPLESMRGLSKILQAVTWRRIEAFHVSLAIRIRPFLGSYSLEMREAAILLFSDLCAANLPLTEEMETSTSGSTMNEALKEQLYANLFPLLLHLSESEETIKRACKNALRRVCSLLSSQKVNDMAQRHLLDHGQLIYDTFITNFVKLIATEMIEHVQDFIDSCIPKLRSQWPEVRGSACIIIGILNNYLAERNSITDIVSQRMGHLLQDDNHWVRVKAATGLGYFYGGT